MSYPIISVIVPVYNAESTIRRCVDSILAQTFTDFECLLIDDGSKDKSGVICDEYAAKDSRIRVFHKLNGGVSSARNVGLDNATGEWIAFVDSDDWVESQYLNTLISISLGQFSVCGFNGYGHIDYSEHFVNIDAKRLLPFLFEHNLIWTPWGKMFYHPIIKEHRLRFDIKLRRGEDTVFCWEYLALCSKISVSALCLYNYTETTNVEDKYNLLFCEHIYIFSRMWDALHLLCKKHCYQSEEGINYAKRLLLSSVATRNELIEVMHYITRQYNPRYDIDKHGGILWKVIFFLIRFRCYSASLFLMKSL